MPQLKEDEWPEDSEPTTTEAAAREPANSDDRSEAPARPAGPVDDLQDRGEGDGLTGPSS